MILGIGSDLIEIARIEGSVARFGDRFLQRVFTEEEIRYCRRKQHGMAESLAARFAAKEAGAKALGTGISRGISWLEIEVRRQPGERPTLHWSGRALAWAERMGAGPVHLTLSHSREAAIAVVVLEAAPPLSPPL